MANGLYNIGSDTRMTIISAGLVLVSTILTSFEPKQKTTLLKSTALDGVNRYRELEEGWDGTLEYDRTDSALDDYFAAKEAGRYAGQQPPQVTFTETTTNTDGSISKYRYTGVTMKMDSGGNRAGDKKVDIKVGWTCSRRIKVL